MSDIAPKHRRKSSGCVVYQTSGPYVNVLLVTSSNPPEKWVLPKGGVTPGLTERESAAKEVYEEAGAIGNVGMFLGDCRLIKNGMVHEISMYAMEFKDYADDWPEQDVRKRRWVSSDFAMLQTDPYMAYFINELAENVAADYTHESMKSESL